MQGAFFNDDAAKCVVYVLNGCKKRNYRELERQKCAHCRAGTEGGPRSATIAARHQPFVEAIPTTCAEEQD